MSEWHYTKDGVPTRPNLYQVVCYQSTGIGEKTISVDGFCLWSGKRWEKYRSFNLLSGEELTEDDINEIYAWADVFLPVTPVLKGFRKKM